MLSISLTDCNIYLLNYLQIDMQVDNILFCSSHIVIDRENLLFIQDLTRFFPVAAMEDYSINS